MATVKRCSKKDVHKGHPWVNEGNKHRCPGVTSAQPVATVNCSKAGRHPAHKWTPPRMSVEYWCTGIKSSIKQKGKP